MSSAGPPASGGLSGPAQAEPDDDLPAGLQVVYRDDRGNRRRVSLDQAALLPLETAALVRKLPSYRGRPGVCGWWWAVTTHAHVPFQSGIERHHIIMADADPDVVAIGGHVVELTWPTGRRGRTTYHVPSLLCRRSDGGVSVIDCRADAQAPRSASAFAAKAAITAAACAAAGWSYHLVGPADPVFAANMRWLAAYRHPRFADTAITDALLATCEQPAPLLEAATAVGDPLAVLPVLYHLLWRAQLHADLSHPLGDITFLSSRPPAHPPPAATAPAPSLGSLQSPRFLQSTDASPATTSDASTPRGVLPAALTAGDAAAVVTVRGVMTPSAGLPAAALGDDAHPRRVLRAGSRVALTGDDDEQHVYTVLGINGTVVSLLDPTGAVAAVHLTLLMAADGFEALDAEPPRRVPAVGVLAQLPEDERQRIQWWEGHLLEVETGVHPDAGEDAAPRPGYDPRRFTLTEREETKVAELTAVGESISLRTLRRMRASYTKHGPLGLADKRMLRQRLGADSIDPRVIATLQDMLSDPAQDNSTVTRRVMFTKLRWRLDNDHGPGQVPLPPERTLYRLADFLDRGNRTFHSAASRRTATNRPPRPYTPTLALRPGEVVQVDTNEIDILCRYADGIIRRPRLTLAICVATRTIMAGIIAPSVKAADAASLLARMLVPEPMRPNWPACLEYAHGIVLHERQLSIDQRLACAAAKPVIVPENVVADNDQVYLSAAFRSACRTLGIGQLHARPGTATDKAIVERTFSSIHTLFAQYVAGYTGRDVTRRGAHVEEQARWNVEQLQDLFDEWVVSDWQTRAHEGLRATWDPGRDLSPNRMYEICVARSGYVPLPLTANDYVELMPAEYRKITDSGITIGGRTYDSRHAQLLRTTGSSLTGAKAGKWEVHWDPYDITAVWVRDTTGTGWVTLPWVYRNIVWQPFGLALWDNVRRSLPGRPNEAEISRAVADLQRRAAGHTTATPHLAPAEASALAVDANAPAAPIRRASEETPAARETPAAEMAQPPGSDTREERDGQGEVERADELDESAAPHGGREPGSAADPNGQFTGGYGAFDPGDDRWRI